jgi:hypothetical protein
MRRTIQGPPRCSHALYPAALQAWRRGSSGRGWCTTLTAGHIRLYGMRKIRLRASEWRLPSFRSRISASPRWHAAVDRRGTSVLPRERVSLVGYDSSHGRGVTTRDVLGINLSNGTPYCVRDVGCGVRIAEGKMSFDLGQSGFGEADLMYAGNGRRDLPQPHLQQTGPSGRPRALRSSASRSSSPTEGGLSRSPSIASSVAAASSCARSGLSMRSRIVFWGLLTITLL